MSKFVVTEYGNKKEILKFPDHYVALAVTVDDDGIEVDQGGKKIVPAGTLVGGGTLEDITQMVSPVNGADTEGVLLNDVDVTHGSASGAMVIHGFINLDKIPEEPDEEVDLPMVQFIK